MKGNRPSDAMIALAVATSRQEWLVADEVRGILNGFGFHVLTQQCAAWLGRISRKDLPPIERRKGHFDEFQYRLTRWGRTELFNRCPGIDVRR